MSVTSRSARSGILEGRRGIELILSNGTLFVFPFDIQEAHIDGLPFPAEHAIPAMSEGDLRLLGLAVEWTAPPLAHPWTTRYLEGKAQGLPIAVLKHGPEVPVEGGVVILGPMWGWATLTHSGLPVRLLPFVSNGEIREGVARARNTAAGISCI